MYLPLLSDIGLTLSIFPWVLILKIVVYPGRKSYDFLSASWDIQQMFIIFSSFSVFFYPSLFYGFLEKFASFLCLLSQNWKSSTAFPSFCYPKELWFVAQWFPGSSPHWVFPALKLELTPEQLLNQAKSNSDQYEWRQVRLFTARSVQSRIPSPGNGKSHAYRATEGLEHL